MPNSDPTAYSPSTYKQIIELIDRALKEDVRSGDITSIACIDQKETISGRLLLKQGGRVAGLTFLPYVFQKIDERVKVHLNVDEGTDQRAGTVLGTVSGPAQAIFAAELVGLNIVQHASGVATSTAEYVERVEGTGCDILDTRKTLPGLRCLEKYAVKVGGGVNHRMGLDDRFIIKKNHLWFIARETKKPIIEAVKRAKMAQLECAIEVETQTIDQVKEALEAQVDIIRLDNMSITAVRKAVSLIDGRAYVEAWGRDITLDTIRSYAETGINGISVTAITVAVPTLPISLRFKP